MQATPDPVYAKMRLKDAIFLRKTGGEVRTVIIWGLKNGRALCPYGIFQQRDLVFHLDKGRLQMIGECEYVLDTHFVPPNNAMLTTNISVIKLLPGFQVDNRLDLVWENEKKSFPLEIYRGTVYPETEVIIHSDIPQRGRVVRNPYSSNERNLFQVILVSGQAVGSCPRGPVDGPLFITSVPQEGLASLYIYGVTTGMVGNDYAVVPLYSSLYNMYGSSLGSFDSGFSSA